MKYRRLSAEELNLLEKEFIQFLAANTVTAEDWVQIKKEKPEVAEKLIELFSDNVLDQVLGKIVFTENYLGQEVRLAQYGTAKVEQIIIKTEESGPDISTPEALAKAVSEEQQRSRLSIYTATKKYTGDRKAAVFSGLQKGAAPTQGQFFKVLATAIKPDKGQD